MIFTTATPPACYATVNAFYADPNDRERGGVHVRIFFVGDPRVIAVKLNAKMNRGA